MDKIHDVDNKPWISKRLLNLKTLIEKRRKELADQNIALQTPNEGNEHLVKALQQFIDTKHESLSQQFLFNTNDERTLVVDKECELSCYKLQLAHSRRLLESRSYRVEYLSNLEITRRELLMRHLASMNNPPLAQGVLESPAKKTIKNFVTLLTIQMWPQPSSEIKVRLEKEIIFRADNLLTDLRNQFKCQKDYCVPIELSDNPDQIEKISRGEMFKSAFFLIHDTFYNDMRDRNNIDLSAGIRQWADKKVLIVNDEGANEFVNRGIGPFKTARMENTRLQELEFRLGCPYLYLHQGNCEHLFTISDIRYVPDNVTINAIDYPSITATSIGRKNDHLKCYMCKDRPPHWYTRNNDRLPLDPYFFCEDCFYMFNYDSNRKKIGQFQAYLYTSTLGIPDSVMIGAIGENT